MSNPKNAKYWKVQGHWRVRVICPECFGAGGQPLKNKPPKCHRCKIVMQPADDSKIVCTWGEAVHYWQTNLLKEKAMKPEVNKACEVSIAGNLFHRCVPRFVGERTVVLDFDNGPKEQAYVYQSCEFREIKSDREKLVDELLKDLLTADKLWVAPKTVAQQMAALGWKKDDRPIEDFTKLYAEFREALPGGMPIGHSDFVEFLNATVVAYRK